MKGDYQCKLVGSQHRDGNAPVAGVNHLDTVETGQMRTPTTCSRSKDCEKLGGGLGTRPRTHLIQCGRSLVSLSLRLAGQTSVDGS